MSVKTISRTALALSSSQCTFTHIVPTIIGRRTITGPIASRSSPQPFQKRRQPPPHKLSDYQNSPSTQERHDLVDRIRSSNYSPQNKARQASISRTEVDRHALNVAIERQQFRRWKPGDVYAPHDLSSVEMRKWSKRRGVQGDVFEALDLDPRSEYKNYSIMWEYVTNMGRIKHSRDTGLGNVNQRRMAKAVRRSIGMGLMPSVHKHPEMLEAENIAKAKLAANRQGGYFGAGSG